ncbi:MAG: class I SAM-dependent methyltransferase, partial [Vicinamibacterales bacterium]|nr:class I SAM-dependent methyltransferase [Vicinamibacterales bacterium]
MPHDERDGSLSDWLGRFGISWPGQREPLWLRAETTRTPGLRVTRALRRFVEALRPIENPAILDLGPACGPTVSFLGHELGCRIVVADLYAELDRAIREGGVATARTVIAEDFGQAPGSADGVLCWDLIDYVSRDDAEWLGASV